MSCTIQNQDILRLLYNQFVNTVTPNKPTNLQSQNLTSINEMLKQDEADMQAAINSGYKPYLIKTSTIKNTLYQGDTYVIKFNEYSVTITNKTKNYSKKLNLSNLLRGMNQEDKIAFLKKIQTLPGEVLEDLAVECDIITSSTGHNMNIRPENTGFVAAGYYTGSEDSIVTKPQALVHELGHAVDYQGRGNMSGENNNSAIMKNKDFIKAFNIGLARYKKAGGKQYNYNDNSTWISANDNRAQKSNYCTANPRELWAELYTSMMTGSCKSMNTIITYFPEAIEVGKKFLQKVRTEHSPNRHNTPMREILNSISLIA